MNVGDLPDDETHGGMLASFKVDENEVGVRFGMMMISVFNLIRTSTYHSPPLYSRHSRQSPPNHATPAISPICFEKAAKRGGGSGKLIRAARARVAWRGRRERTRPLDRRIDRWALVRDNGTSVGRLLFWDLGPAGMGLVKRHPH